MQQKLYSVPDSVGNVINSKPEKEPEYREAKKIPQGSQRKLSQQGSKPIS
jgi:hypothetical protein